MTLTTPAFCLALSPDEALVLKRARSIAAAPVDDFTLLGSSNNSSDGGYRYQLAFLAYSLCSVVAGEPALRDEGHDIFTRLVEKMERPATIAYWKARGYVGDGLSAQNAMYRGHLNLMYALARDHFGETRFDERFHALSRELFAQISAPHPVCCEPDQVFVQCNSVIALSLALHDRDFATSYGSAGGKLLKWAREHMCLEGTKLVRDGFRPSTGASSSGRTGYANAWTIVFLQGVPGLGPEASAMYADWRRTFAEPSLVPGWVEGAPAGDVFPIEEALESSLMATTFGLLAAREQADEKLYRRLWPTVTEVDHLVAAFEPALPPARRAQARTFRAIALFARTFRGWNEVLAAKRD